MELITPEYSFILWTLLTILASALWIVAFITVSKHSFQSPGDKMYWTLLIILMPILGAILYFIYGRKKSLH